MTLKKILVSTAAVLTLGAALTACSTDDQSGNSGDSQAVNAEQGAFPTTIEHRYGSTEIKEAPQRVVSLGYTDQDALLALGVTPVSVNYWDGMTPDGQAAGNWSNDKIEGETPRIDKHAEVNAEAIAKDKPDLIVAVYSDIDEATYKKLSEIAPVVVQKGEYEELQQPWDVTTVSDENLAVFAEGDPRSRFFTELGFKINPAYAGITKDKFYGEVSKENAAKINSDVLVWDQLSYSSKQSKASVIEDPIVGELPAVKDGRSVYLEGDLEKAFGWQTVLSLNYLLDKIEQPLADATK